MTQGCTIESFQFPTKIGLVPQHRTVEREHCFLRSATVNESIRRQSGNEPYLPRPTSSVLISDESNDCKSGLRVGKAVPG